MIDKVEVNFDLQIKSMRERGTFVNWDLVIWGVAIAEL